MAIFSAKLPRAAFLFASFTIYSMGFSYLSSAEQNEASFKEAMVKLGRIPGRPMEGGMSADILHIIGERAPLMPPEQRGRLTQAVLKYSSEHSHDPYLLLALIETESAYRFDAVSNKGAVGFMQVRPFVAKSIAEEMKVYANPSMLDLKDLDTNLKLGSYYLSKMKERFGDLDLALAAYNQGPTKLTAELKQGRKPDFKYTKKVLGSRRSIMKMPPLAVAGKNAA